MKIFDYLSRKLKKTVKRKSRKELEEELKLTQDEVVSLKEKLNQKNEKIIQQKKEIESYMDSKYRFFVTRTITAYVLDASFCGCYNFKQEFKKIIDSSKKIILTDITIRELKKIQTQASNKTSEHARNILDCALLYKQKFICEKINKLDSPDNSIIRFCSEHKSRVELMTCDKEMALLAEAEDVKVECFEGFGDKKVFLDKIVDLNWRGYVEQFEYSNKFVMIKNHINGENIFSGEYKITPGDEIFIIYDKKGNYEFEHYMIPANQTQKAMLVYRVVIWSEEEASNLKRKDYRRFVRNYLSKKAQEGS